MKCPVSLFGLFGDSYIHLCRTFLRFQVKISEGVQTELAVRSAVSQNISNNVSDIV